ncbi:DUF5615 family PIN-like protein [Candidatus Methylocalor cossyra]|uniref:DUF5615 domain-containing protein n=1 Tax=Candidatus Methylocalor cossyra TaxID=3108543 RepID=A0ABP1CCZ2_9GAMM
MRSLVDAQRPPALARMLAAKGFDAEHVHNVGRGEAEDGAIWDHAATSGAGIVAKDEDFASLITLHPNGPPIVWIRVGSTCKQALLR